MLQRVIEWIRYLCLNVFCVVWRLAASHKYNSNSLAAVLHINKSNAAGNSKRLYTPALVIRIPEVKNHGQDQWSSTWAKSVSSLGTIL